jgi:hypothetical protein
MDRIAPLVLAEKWDNVSLTIEEPETVKLTSRCVVEVGLLLGHHNPLTLTFQANHDVVYTEAPGQQHRSVQNIMLTVE